MSIPGYVIKKNNKRGARHGPSERQRMYFKAKEMLHKAGQKNHGEHSSILARWLSDCKYRDSLTRIGWTEQDIMPFDRIALENHSYGATRSVRIRHSEHWILKLNQDGPQQPSNERPDFARAKRECKRIHDEYMSRDPTGIQNHPFLEAKRVRQRQEQAFEGIEEYDCAVDPRTGAGKPVVFVAIVIVHKLGKRATTGRQEVRIPGILHGLTIREFFSDRTSFCWPGEKPTGVWTEHPTRTTHLYTYSASQNAPRRCFNHATRVAHDCAL